MVVKCEGCALQHTRAPDRVIGRRERVLLVLKRVRLCVHVCNRGTFRGPLGPQIPKDAPPTSMSLKSPATRCFLSPCPS